MDLSRVPPVARAALALAVVLVLGRLCRAVVVWRKRAAYKRQHGVRAAPWLDQHPLLRGYDTTRENMRAMREHRTQDVLMQRFLRMGANTMQMYILGRHIHITVEPQNLKTIQAVDHKKWHLNSRRKKGFELFLGKGIFTTDGPEWQHSRDMLRPNFVRSQVGDLDVFEAHVSHLMAKMPRDGATVDLCELFFRLTMDSATEFLFGESTNSLSDGSGQEFAAAFGRCQDDASRCVQLGRFYTWTRAAREARKDIALMHEFADYYVDMGLARRQKLLADDKAGAQPPGRYVFLDELVRQTDDRVRIRSELLNILIAGRDTTASLLTNVWAMLAKRPDIWRRLQAELATLDGHRPSFAQLKDLKFLRALLNESLRLHPIVPANGREANEDTTLPVGGGPDGSAPIFIPKGGLVIWSVFAMHRRKDLFGDDADDFRPDRWLDDPATGKKGLRPGWEYLPFNGGARICLGQQFALAEASYATIRLCQEFDRIESRDPHDWEESTALTTVNLHGAKVGLFPREVS